MNEPTYVEVLDIVLAIKDGRQAILDALFADLPDVVQEQLSCDLWSWSCDAPPAFDLALGDEKDVIKAALEFKAPGTNVQFSSLHKARTLNPGTDTVSQKIYRDEIEGVDARFDAPHPYVEVTCAAHAHTGSGAAGIHQGDLYRACMPGVTNMNRPADHSEVTFIFVAPEAAADDAWRTSLVSADEWHTVYLPDILPRWRSLVPEHPHMAVLVEATHRFLGEPARHSL